MTEETESRAAHGIFYGLGAYLVWGFTPAYWKMLREYDALELLGYRILWSLVAAMLILLVTRSFAEFGRVLRTPRRLVSVGVAAGLLAANWLVFLYAVMSEQVLATSLGYYLNPLINVVLGFVVLGERLRPLQWLAVACAATGVGHYIFALGALPWISVFLAMSFGLYGLIRKQVQVEPVVGFGIEMTVLAGPALLCLTWIGFAGRLSIPVGNWSTDALVASSALITATPLLLFNAAVKRLTLITVGILQYIAPSIGFALAVVAYGEPFDAVHAWTFGWVWSGLALFTLESFLEARRTRRLGTHD